MTSANGARRKNGFSLVELLIAVMIILLLVAILLPVIGRVRRASRTTACLSNLRQWGQAFQAYLNANHGQPAIGLEIHQRQRWWEILGPYNGNVRPTLLCPESLEKPVLSPKYPDGADGSAHQAW